MIQDDTFKVKDGLTFITKCLDIFYSESSVIEVIQKLNDSIIGKNFLFSSPVEFVRIGIFNHWFSVGPLDLWKKGEALNEKEIEKRIQSRPEIKKSSLNYQGLAFIYNFNHDLGGPYYILKTPCCKKIEDEWVVDFDLIDTYMKAFIYELR